MATTTNFGWETPDDTDLVKDGAAAIRTALGGVDTSFVDLKGGTTGQVLAKASATDLDFSWVAVDPLTILDAKGDLITATAADTPARLAVGTNGQTLVADSSTSTGLKWATPSSGALTLIKRATTTGAVNTGTTFDSVFTSTYKTYVVYISDFSAATGTDVPKFQFRFGGTTRATDYYGATQNIERSGSIVYNSNVAATASTIGNAGVLDSSAPAAYTFTINRVGNSSQKPHAYFQGIGAANQYLLSGAIFNDVAATYDGFILSAASNITVTVAVYGLATS